MEHVTIPKYGDTNKKSYSRGKKPATSDQFSELSLMG